MSTKRFTDIEKWKKKFIKSLPTEYKLLWLYILDDCDNAGVWHVDLEVASIRIGASVNKDEAIKLFDTHIEVFDNCEKWFIVDFIFFQCGCHIKDLNSKNNAHLSIIRKIHLSPLKDLIEGLGRAQLGPQEEEKEEEEDIDKEEDKEKEEESKSFLKNLFKKNGLKIKGYEKE